MPEPQGAILAWGHRTISTSNQVIVSALPYPSRCILRLKLLTNGFTKLWPYPAHGARGLQLSVLRMGHQHRPCLWPLCTDKSHSRTFYHSFLDRENWRPVNNKLFCYFIVETSTCFTCHKGPWPPLRENPKFTPNTH